MDIEKRLDELEKRVSALEDWKRAKSRKLTEEELTAMFVRVFQSTIRGTTSKEE